MAGPHRDVTIWECCQGWRTSKINVVHRSIGKFISFSCICSQDILQHGQGVTRISCVGMRALNLLKCFLPPLLDRLSTTLRYCRCRRCCCTLRHNLGKVFRSWDIWGDKCWKLHWMSVQHEIIVSVLPGGACGRFGCQKVGELEHSGHHTHIMWLIFLWWHWVGHIRLQRNLS